MDVYLYLCSCAYVLSAPISWSTCTKYKCPSADKIKAGLVPPLLSLVGMEYYFLKFTLDHAYNRFSKDRLTIELK